MDLSYDGIVKDARERMEKAVEHLEHDFKGIRTGRAAPGLVDHIKVDYYGSMTPINQLAQVSTPDPRTIAVKPFDVTQISAIEKAIQASDLGIMPISDGKLIRLPVPMLTEQQRNKLIAHIKDMGETQRVAIRNIRRDGNKAAQQAKKDSALTEDDEKLLEKEIQELTKKYEGRIDELIKAKSEELSTV